MRDAYDRRKLAECESRRRHVKAVLDKEKRELADVDAGRRTVSLAKRAAMVQAEHEAQEEMARLTKEIVHLKKMIERQEHPHG